MLSSFSCAKKDPLRSLIYCHVSTTFPFLLSQKLCIIKSNDQHCLCLTKKVIVFTAASAFINKLDWWLSCALPLLVSKLAPIMVDKPQLPLTMCCASIHKESFSFEKRKKEVQKMNYSRHDFARLFDENFVPLTFLLPRSLGPINSPTLSKRAN